MVRQILSRFNGISPRLQFLIVFVATGLASTVHGLPGDVLFLALGVFLTGLLIEMWPRLDSHSRNVRLAMLTIYWILSIFVTIIDILW